MRSEEGMMTTFAVVMVTALILCVGLVYDGGALITARVNAIATAQGAARAGAQAIDVDAYRVDGQIVLDQSKATAAAHSYLSRAEETGTVVVIGSEVHVDVTESESTTFLSIAGLNRLTVHGSGAARAVQGGTQ